MLEDTAADFAKTQKQSPWFLWQLFEFLRLPKPREDAGAHATAPGAGAASTSASAATTATATSAAAAGSTSPTAKKHASKLSNAGSAAIIAMVQAQDEELARAGLLEKARTNGMPVPPLPPGAGKAAHAAAAQAALDRARPLALEEIRPLTLPDHVRADAAVWPPPPNGPSSLYSPPPPLSLLDAAIPHTVVYEDGQIVHWFFSSVGKPAGPGAADGDDDDGAPGVPANTILRKKRRNCTPANVARTFLSDPASKRITPWCSSRDLDIVATFYPKSVSELHVVVPLFLSREQLERFVKERAQRMRISGVLQAFVAPMGTHNTLLRVEWTPVETKVLERVAGLPIEHPASRGKGNDVDSRITTFERNWQAPLAEGALVIDPNWTELERRQHEEAYLDSMLAGNLIGGSEAAGLRNKSALTPQLHHPHKITLAPAPPTIAPLIPASLLFVAPPAEKSALPSASAPDALDKEEKEAALIKDPTAAAAAAAAATLAAAAAEPVALQTTLAYNEHRIQQIECLDQNLVATLNSYAWLIALHLKAVLVRHQKGVANPGLEASQPLLPVKLVLYFKRGSGGKLFLLFMDEFLAAGGNPKLLSKFEATMNDPLRDAILLNNNPVKATVAGVGTIKALAGKVGVGGGSGSVDGGGSTSKKQPAHSSDSDDDGASPLSSTANSRHGSAPRNHPSKKPLLTLASDSAADSALAASKRSFTVSATSLRRAPFNASNMGLREWMRYCWSWRVGEYEWNRSLGIMELHREMRRETRKAAVEANNAAQALAHAFPFGAKAAPREPPWSSGKSSFARARATKPTTFVPPTRDRFGGAANALSVPGISLSRSRRTASQHSIDLSRLASMDFSDVPLEERPGTHHACAHCKVDFALGPESVLADQTLSLFVVLPRLVASALGLSLQAPSEEGGGAAQGAKSLHASKKAHAVVDSSIWYRVLLSFYPALTEPKVRQLLRDQAWMENTLVPLCEICVNEVRGVPVLSEEFEAGSSGSGGSNGPASPTAAAAHKAHASSLASVRGPVHDLTDATLAELDISLREYLGLPLHVPILLVNGEQPPQQPSPQQQQQGGTGADRDESNDLDTSLNSAADDSFSAAAESGVLSESELQAQARKERKALKRAAKRQAEEAAARAARHARIEAEAARLKAKALGQPLPVTDAIKALLDERVPLEPVDPISATLDPSHDPAKLLNPELESSPLFAAIATGSGGGSVSAVQAHAEFVARGGGTLHPPPPHPIMRSMRAANKRAAAAAAAAAANQDNSDDDEPAQPQEPSLAAYHREQEWLRQLTAAALAEGDGPQPSSPSSSTGGGVEANHSGGSGAVAASWSFLRNSRARAREAHARTSQRREREWRQADEAAQREHDAKMKLEGTPELRQARAERFSIQREQQRIWRAAAMEQAQEQAEAEIEAQAAQARLEAYEAELAARKASRSALERIPFPMLAAAGPTPNFPAPETVAQYVRAQGLPDSYTTAYARAYEIFLKDVAERAEKDRRALAKKQRKQQQQKGKRGMKGSASAPTLPPITTVYAPGSSHPQSSAASAAVAAAAARRVQRRPWDDRPVTHGASLRSSPLVDASQLPATHANRWDSAHSRPSTSLNTLAPRAVVDPQKRTIIRGGGGRLKDEFDEIVDRVAELKARQAEQAEAEAAAARASGANRERSRSPTMRSNSPLRSSSPLRSAAPPVPPSHSTLSAYVSSRSVSHGMLPTVREARSGTNSLGATTSSFGDSPSRVTSAQRLRPGRRVGFEGGAESGEASDDDSAAMPRPPQGLAYAHELKAWWAASHRSAEKSDRLRQNAKYSLDKYRDEREARVAAKLAMQMMDQKEEAWRREQAAAAVDTAQLAPPRRPGGGASRLHADAIEEEKDSALSTASHSRKHSSRSVKSNHSGRGNGAGNSSDRSTTSSTGSEPLLPRSSVSALKALHAQHAQDHGAHCNCLELLSLVERGGRSSQPKHARQPTSVARQKLDEWLRDHEAEAATLAQIEEQQQQQQQQHASDAAGQSKAAQQQPKAPATVSPPAQSARDLEQAAATASLLSLFHSGSCPCFPSLLSKVDAKFVAELVRMTAAMVAPSPEGSAAASLQSLHDRTMALLASISSASSNGGASYGERELLEAVREKCRVFSIVHELDHDAPAPPSMASAKATPVFPVKKMPLCNLCDDETATVQCTDCEEPYCPACNVDFHKPAKNASHTRLPLVVV